MDGNSNETEIAEIFARANESTSYTSYADPLSMPSLSSRAEETKVISQKMRILLMKGLSGLYKAFPEENKNHQVLSIAFVFRWLFFIIVRKLSGIFKQFSENEW